MLYNNIIIILCFRKEYKDMRCDKTYGIKSSPDIADSELKLQKVLRYLRYV